ncbi:helix-turn-helix domain-containing protein [Mesobacillus zeae]|uniref:Helix-turn-helix domain-containing protein n=1 Tax=Mesobacillus zeae TaxID=1917180 RepID=A0A398BLA8_9BACI|nr:helix-turn-helix domain-containing protein [Mesobacillus zeae]RID88153.1 helix-turn-helix domain-containing protein [Mesobacillus zeae]
MSELGIRLREAREAKGLSLDELQEATKIQKRYLVGIEEGNYNMMPGKFYVRAFIKQYAEAVGLDPEEVFEQHKSEIPATYNEDIPEQLSRVQSRKSFSPADSRIMDYLPKILIGVVAVGLVVLIWWFFAKSNGDEAAKEPVSQESESVKYEESEDIVDKQPADETGENKDNADKEKGKKKDKTKSVQELSVVENGGNKMVYDLKNSDKFEVKLATTEASWVSIESGSGKSIYQGTLNKAQGNESQTFDLSKETEISIIAGFSPATELYINGEKVEDAFPKENTGRQDVTVRYIKSE